MNPPTAAAPRTAAPGPERDPGAGPPWAAWLGWALERLLVVAAVAYTLRFAYQQTPDLLDRRVLEWDARAFALAAFRYHGSGLFPSSLPVDFVASVCTPGWKAVYWLGTLFLDPFALSKGLPFLGLALLLWHGFALGRQIGGLALGAGCVLVLVHCSLIWDRMVGANPRAFGFPLLVVFLRYALAGAERKVLATLVLQAACYPSVFVVCAPAWGLCSLLEPDRLRRIVRLGLAGLLSVALIPSAYGRVDPRLGKPPTYAEAATLRQMQPGGAQPFYPLPPPSFSLKTALHQTLGPSGKPVWPAAQAFCSRAAPLPALTLLVVAAVAAAWRRARRLVVFAAMLVSSLLAFAVSYPLAYRLFLPERFLTYTWPVLLPLAVLLGLREGLCRWLPHAASTSATLVVAALIFLGYGDGLPGRIGLHDWRQQDTTVTRYLRTLPPQVTVAAQPRVGTFVLAFAQRQAYLAATTNMLPHAYRYGLEMERRFEAFYRAYYARDLADIRRFMRSERVDYLIVDARDFGPEALARARFAQPWITLTDALLTAVPPESLPLAQPPPQAVVFREGPLAVIDLSRL